MARSVCTPYRASAGTSRVPRGSFSVRMLVGMSSRFGQAKYVSHDVAYRRSPVDVAISIRHIIAQRSFRRRNIKPDREPIEVIEEPHHRDDLDDLTGIPVRRECRIDI